MICENCKREWLPDDKVFLALNQVIDELDALHFPRPAYVRLPVLTKMAICCANPDIRWEASKEGI